MTPSDAPRRGPGAQRSVRDQPLSPRSPRVIAALLCGWLVASGLSHAQDPKAMAATKPALTVQAVTPQREQWPLSLTAHGALAAWQEAAIGAEGGPWRLAEVRVDVGETVRRGQVLARFDDAAVQAELALARAGVAEAEAVLAEMAAKAQRARELQPTGVLSTEQVQQALTAERTAQARLQAQRAALQLQEVRAQQTRVLAPDDGTVSARAAAVGAVVAPGQELFRLIRQSRVEWRAEVGAEDLRRIRAGQAVRVTLPGGASVSGRVRSVAPTVDAATRNALVYVDLPAVQGARPGAFARGDFAVGSGTVLSLPQSAVLLREGFAYVFRLSADGRVQQVKVSTGLRQGDRVEIVAGLQPTDRIVAAGGGFLADGDAVRVVP